MLKNLLNFNLNNVKFEKPCLDYGYYSRSTMRSNRSDQLDRIILNPTILAKCPQENKL